LAHCDIRDKKILMNQASRRDPDAAPVSETTRTVTASTSTSWRLWDLDWADHLPFVMGDVTVELGSFEDGTAFFRDHYEEVFGKSQTSWFREELSVAKRRFMLEMDAFVFRKDGRAIGLAMGHPTDWSTYYVRLLALLPEFRERHLTTQFEEHLCATLKSVGVTRCEAECSPGNRAMMKMFLNQGWHLSATAQSERFGTNIRFTRYLDEKAEDVFCRQYLSVPAYGRTTGGLVKKGGLREDARDVK
jgi:Acetyltransferase (GNAT) family